MVGGAPGGGKEGPLSPESKLALGELGDEDPLLGLTRDCKENGEVRSGQWWWWWWWCVLLWLVIYEEKVSTPYNLVCYLNM